jgi:hypothetical protein
MLKNFLICISVTILTMLILNLINISMIYAQTNTSTLSSLPNSIEGLEKELGPPVENFSLLTLPEEELSSEDEEFLMEELEERTDETFLYTPPPITNNTISGPELNNTSLKKTNTISGHE